MSGVSPHLFAAAVLLVVVVYLLVRVFIVGHPKNERTVVEVIEYMLLELIGAALILVAVVVYTLFF